MTFRAASYEAIPAGVYDATLTTLSEGENDFGSYRKWTFAVETPGGTKDLSAMTSGASGPRSKAYSWAQALLGRKPGTDEEQLTGLRCQVHLVVNDEGFNRVAALLPAKAVTGQGTLNLERLDEKVYKQPQPQPQPQDAIPF